MRQFGKWANGPGQLKFSTNFWKDENYRNYQLLLPNRNYQPPIDCEAYLSVGDNFPLAIIPIIRLINYELSLI